MALHRSTLNSEVDAGSADDFELSARDISSANADASWRVSKRSLKSGLSRGVEVVEIDNGRLRFAIIPTRGMGIWRAWVDGNELGWHSPIRGPVHPSFVPIAEPSGNGWLMGFDELMCRCGLESNGAPDFNEQGRLSYPLHGRIANLPAHSLEVVVDDVEATVSLHGIVEESRYHYQKLRMRTSYTTHFGSSRIAWHDEVENVGGGAAGMQMLYHTNIGRPQLDGGSRMLLPIAQFANGDSATSEDDVDGWDTYLPPVAGFSQQVYYFRLLGDDDHNTLTLLKNSNGSSGVGLTFNISQLPCFTLWRNLVAEADGYVTGIEPGTNFPNPRSIEERAGRVVPLEPGQKWQADVALDWFLQASAVRQAEQRIHELQGSHTPRIQALSRL
jgi:Domain of unknown function (DUF4432)